MGYASSITSKGQVTIPAPIRRKLGLEKGGAAAFSINRAGEVTITKPKTLAEVRALLRKPTHADPLSEREELVGKRLAKKHDVR